MKMAKPWPMLASALNDWLGWRARPGLCNPMYGAFDLSVRKKRAKDNSVACVEQNIFQNEDIHDPTKEPYGKGHQESKKYAQAINSSHTKTPGLYEIAALINLSCRSRLISSAILSCVATVL